MTPRPSIEWLPWGEAAFDLAATTQRPILLRVAAPWCLSCRLMADEVDVDPLVAATVAEHYVPVYVDSDRQPEIGERYNLGGWPTNAFLTPRGDLITGGTYFDVDTFRRLVARVAQNWAERRVELEEAVGARRRELDERRRPRPIAEPPTIDSVEAIVDLTVDEFDFRYGGFGRDSKFPHTPSIELLFAEYRRTGETRLRDAALLSLEAMWAPDGGRPRLADAAGGFFRYASRRDWSEPHYEKMLEENARLLSAFLSAHQLTGEARWAKAARSILGFVLDTFADRAKRYFRSSQAGWPGREYYELPVEERLKRPAPYVDPTAYVGSNALMASAFVKAGIVLGEDAMLELGAAVVDGLVSRGRLREDELLLGHVYDQRGAEGPILLASQVYAAKSLVDAYEALGGSSRLVAAAELLDEVHARLRDAARQVYIDTPIELGAEGYLNQPLVPLAENCVAAETLLRLSDLLEAPNYRTRAHGLLRAISSYAPDYGFLAAPFAIALSRALVRERLAISIAGPKANRTTRLLARASHAIYAPFKVVRFLEPERDSGQLRAIEAHLTTGPLAIVCHGAACAEPVFEPDQLLSLVARAAVASFPPGPGPGSLP